jgi:hypothetical protein
MSDYYAKCRSNYFKVKDEDSFREWIGDYDVEIFTDTKNGDQLFGFISCDGFGCIPVIWEDEETGEERSILDEISEYLADGETVVIQEVGSEKMRYFCGIAIAIHSSGKFVNLNLRDIYQIATEKFGGEISECEY